MVQTTNQVVVPSSSEENDIFIPLKSTTDYETSDVQNDNNDGDKDLSAADLARGLWMESPSSLSKKRMKESFLEKTTKDYKKLVVQPKGSKNVYSPVAWASGCYVEGQICDVNRSQFSSFEFHFVLNMCS